MIEFAHYWYLKAALFIPCVILSACVNDSSSYKSNEQQIIHSDRIKLKADLDKAKDVSLKTGRSVVIRMTPRSNIEQMKDDQAYAKRLISENYGSRL